MDIVFRPYRSVNRAGTAHCWLRRIQCQEVSFLGSAAGSCRRSGGPKPCFRAGALGLPPLLCRPFSGGPPFLVVLTFYFVAAIQKRIFQSLGGECEIYAIDLPAERLAEGEAWVHQMHDRLTRFTPTSELSRFNASAGQWTEVSALLEALLRESLRADEMTGGLVNIAVLPALLAAGYTRTFSEGPTSVTISAPPPALPDVLEVRAGAARLRQGAAVDLGGIAKGWLADRLAADLGANALVNLCGDLYARGGGEDGEGWPVGMGDQTVMLLDMGAATSGTKKRSWGEGLHHLIDPRTGQPSATDIAEVSVLARSGADAEILAKAALLLGSSAGADFLRQHGALGWSFSR